ncbi:MAG: hypothetical protein Q4A84_02345 [Neisseria sp.]|uniref:hypothetical protein n=1 Tax=Neisseria sp. TaxID=192066 RepID=UPI0026DBE75C|nr:hypothetical protein [Neisseria sp.]MDO4640532.1 hypothetical protein [Neisseria sp.]
MKRIVSLLTVALLSIANLSACSEPENGMSIQEQTERRFQLNPHPKQAYRIKVKINDAPGPLKLINDMYVGYKAENCSYLISKVAGAYAKPEKTIKTKMNQIGQDEYETVVYFDAMQDEDYFGEGICRWKIENFGTSFKATGKPEETEFNVSDLMKHLIEKKTLIKYYRKGGYPYFKNDDGSIYNGKDMVSFGTASPNEYRKDLQKDLFSIMVILEGIKE